jgi:hypothetical protein
LDNIIIDSKNKRVLKAHICSLLAGQSIRLHTLITSSSDNINIGKLLADIWSALGLIEDKDYFTVVSREDFIDKILGWSWRKTKKLIEANLNKVIYINEAYTLHINDKDVFGEEAINTLCSHLYEHQGEVNIIVSGEKTYIQQSLLDRFPGLNKMLMLRLEL